MASPLTQFAPLTSLPAAAGVSLPLAFAQDSNNPPHNPHNPKDSREILPPGQLHREDGDSALTGITRSLQRRLLGLRDFAKNRYSPASTEKDKKPD